MNLVDQQGSILPSGDCATFARRVANAESQVTQLGDAEQACQSADAFITCASRFESTTQKVKAADGGASGAAGAGRAGG